MSLATSSKYSYNFVSQDQINALLGPSGEPQAASEADPLGDIADFIDTDEIDRLLGDDPAPLEEPMTDDKPDDLYDMDAELSMVSMEDIERLLAEDKEPARSPEPEPVPEEELSLEEVLGPVEESQEPSSDGDVISQDDIERLLKSSGASEEGEESSGETAFQISREDIESLLSDTTEEDPLPAEAVPVARESDAADDTPFEPEVKSRKKKIMVIASAAVLVLAIAGGAAFFFLSGPPAPSVEIQAPIEEIPAVLPVAGEALPEPMITTRLDRFILPAPSEASYVLVSMDVVLTIRGVEEDPLSGYQEFYRKRLFDALSKKIAESGTERPVSGDLREIVRRTVGTALPEGVLESVVFENYLLQ